MSLNKITLPLLRAVLSFFYLSAGDLTDGRLASRNPDGVMFYKIWNGRAKPKMPAMKTDITRADVWTVIHYVKTLRQ